MSAIPTDLIALKSKLKATWESGDYGVFAKYLEPSAIEFFNRLNILPGTKLLDIACGAGQLTIPAAKRGIQVTAIDLAENLVAQARDRAKSEGLNVQIDQGDAEDLPYADASFDVVLSLIGAMFAPRPELVASEMLRVCAPGGKIIMGNWTLKGFIGQMFATVGKYLAPSFPSPTLWGDEGTLRKRFAIGISDLTITPHLYRFKYPFPPEGVVEFFITYYGPTNRAHSVLNEEARISLKADLTELWSTQNRATDGRTEVLAEYVEVIGIRDR